MRTLILLIVSLLLTLVVAIPRPDIADARKLSTDPKIVDAPQALAFDCARVPPAFWCAGDVRAQCGTTELCTRHDAAVRSRPLHITLLYESLCPDCQSFIKNTLFDVYSRFGSHIELELVPYGNARTMDNGQIVCQHGEEECRVNKFQSCLINYLSDPMPFIYCLESLLADNLVFGEASKLCFNFFQLNQLTHEHIMQCFNGTEGDRLQTMHSQRTESVWPSKHQYVPWIVVNNASIGSMQFLQNALPALICESRAWGEYISECEIL